MSPDGGLSLGVLAVRIDGIREDVTELREYRREDAVRLRTVEDAVKTMIDTQKVSRAFEERRYRRMANAVQVGGLAMAAAMLILAVVQVVISQ